MFHQDAAAGGARPFTRQFWRLSAVAGVLAVIGVEGARPALLAVVPMAHTQLLLRPCDDQAAVAAALALAGGRAVAV